MSKKIKNFGIIPSYYKKKIPIKRMLAQVLVVAITSATLKIYTTFYPPKVEVLTNYKPAFSDSLTTDTHNYNNVQQNNTTLYSAQDAKKQLNKLVKNKLRLLNINIDVNICSVVRVQNGFDGYKEKTQTYMLISKNSNGYDLIKFESFSLFNANQYIEAYDIMSFCTFLQYCAFSGINRMNDENELNQTVKSNNYLMCGDIFDYFENNGEVSKAVVILDKNFSAFVYKKTETELNAKKQTLFSFFKNDLDSHSLILTPLEKSKDDITLNKALNMIETEKETESNTLSSENEKQK